MKKKIDLDSPEFLWAVFESLLDLGKTEEALRVLEVHPEIFDLFPDETKETEEEVEASWQRLISYIKEKENQND